MIDHAVLNNLKALIARLITNFSVDDYDLRRESAIALSKFKGAKATDFLLETYESDNIQDFMALALGNIDNSKAIELLINALNDSQQEVRFNAARALGMLENPEALDILLEALNSYAETNSNTIDTENKSIDEHVTQMFMEEDAIIGAIVAVGKIKNNRAVSILKRLLNQEKSPRIRASVIMALGMMSSDRLLPIFQAALRDDDPRVRANAIEAIELQRSGGSVVGILQPYLDDPNNRVKANVAKAIWKYGDFDVTEHLKAMLSSQDKWQRSSAAYAIGETHDARFLHMLTKALKDEDPDVRRNATNALRKLELKSALPLVKPLLSDPNFDVRVEATLAITRCSPEEAYPVLVDKLSTEENFIVQATMISCLGQLGSAETVRIIMRFLDSEDPRVVSNTIDALVKLTQTPDRAMIAKLETLLSHEDNRVKSTSIRTLWLWGEYGVLDSLLNLFINGDKKHVLSATFVFGEIGRAISESTDFREKVDKILEELLTSPEQAEQSLSDAPDNLEAPQQEVPEAQGQPSGTSQPISQDNAASQLRHAPQTDTEYNEELNRALELVSAHEYDKAENIYKEIWTKDPDNLKNLMAYANLCFMLKRYVDAEGLYHKVISINPSIVKALFNLGTVCFYMKKYEDAITYLARALTLYPKILGAYIILAQIYELANRYPESIKLLSHAVALSPRNPVIYQKLSVLHIRLKDFESASQVLKRAVEVAPADVEARLQLAYCLKFSGHVQEAFDILDSTIRDCSSSADSTAAYQMFHKAYVSFVSLINDI